VKPTFECFSPPPSDVIILRRALVGGVGIKPTYSLFQNAAWITTAIRLSEVFSSIVQFGATIPKVLDTHK
jgi:hypothetical protein